jgi:hypothetical protein
MSPWWKTFPQNTLQGHPNTDHLMQEQIFAYSVKNLDENEVVRMVAQNLNTLL